MIQSLLGPVTELAGKFIQDKDKAAELAHDLSTMAERHAQELAKGQLEINKAEAASGSLFKGGWRPAVGWVCVCGFAINFLVSPIAAGFGVDIPQADAATLMPVLMGMLGLGGLRTVEKMGGKASK